MVHARLKFTQHGQPQTALLTDRGWTIIHGNPGEISLLNHICPLTDPDQAQICAARAAELLRGTIEP